MNSPPVFFIDQKIKMTQRMTQRICKVVVKKTGYVSDILFRYTLIAHGGAVRPGRGGLSREDI